MTDLDVEGLNVRYGDLFANKNISLKVRKGEYLVILGPTGAGKTTLLKSISGLEDRYKGSIRINGKCIDDMTPYERPVAYLGQNYSLFPHMTVWQNTVFGPFMKGATEQEIDDLGKEMLSLVRLEGRMDAYPGELSGGMKQRNALARVLAYESDILLLDEPLRALDARLRIDLRYEIRRLARFMEKTVLHVTHDQEEALTIADRIAIMKGGELVQIGSPEEVYNAPMSPFVQNFMGGANFLLGKVRSVTKEKAVVHTEDGGEWDVLPNGLEEGRDVVMSIKHDYTVLIPHEKSSGSNRIKGRVKRRLFTGAFATFELETETGATLLSRIPSAVEMKFEPDMKINAFLPKKHIIAFPLTKDEFEKNMEVK